ncbi:MAG: hypothetical protein IH907_08945 [Proteobacteria bacterium]|nr:hypothetical protein [Pseudomonadota bacterium]
MIRLPKSMISPMSLRFIPSDETAANPAAFFWFAGRPSGPIGMLIAAEAAPAGPMGTPIGPAGPPPDYCELIRASRPCKPVKQTGHKDRLSHRKSALSPDEIMSSIVE